MNFDKLIVQYNEYQICAAIANMDFGKRPFSPEDTF